MRNCKYSFMRYLKTPVKVHVATELKTFEVFNSEPR